MAATVVMQVSRFTQRVLKMWWVCDTCCDIWKECAAFIFSVIDSSVAEGVLESKKVKVIWDSWRKCDHAQFWEDGK